MRAHFKESFCARFGLCCNLGGEFVVLIFATQHWPDSLDLLITAFWLAIVIGVPFTVYLLMVVDYRRYLRSLRRTMVFVGGYLPVLPEWVLQDTPYCFYVFNLSLPCSAEDVLAAYRGKVKSMHPDRGGDRKAFLVLQRHFEQAMAFVEK